MHRQKGTQEGKLRAACDRCHELKNRCVRAGGPDSRCDRCERLDIDCVYRTTSRMGRPRVQTNRNGNGNGTGSGGSNTTLNETPSDMMSFLVSPEVTQHADMDWGHLEFSQNLDSINDSLGNGTTPPFQAPEPFPFPEPCVISNLEQTTDRLLKLQGQLHRLLSVTDRPPAPNLIEEGLEVAKSFLEILQARIDLHGLTSDANSHATDSRLPAGKNRSGDIISSAAGVDIIMVEQALLCYSYVLQMLNRLVRVLTSKERQSALELPAAVSLGFFSLASQPALNAGVMLHLILRMVTHSRSLVQQLASGCKDLEDPSSSPSDSAVSTGSSPGKVYASSIAATSHGVANLVGEREKMLVERLSFLTNCS